MRKIALFATCISALAFSAVALAQSADQVVVSDEAGIFSDKLNEVEAAADRIQRRADVADARFERALGDVSDQVQKDVVIAQAQSRLEQRKARLALPSPENKG